MREFFKRIKMDVIFGAIICIILGIVLILYPTEVTTIACQVIGAVIAVLGIVRVISYIMSDRRQGVQLALGLILFLVGAWILIKPNSIQNLILIGIGVALFVHGIEDFGYALEAKRGGYDSWAILILMAIISMVFGVLCIVDCFGMIELAMTFVGIALIYDGISDIWIVSRVTKTAKAIKQEMDAVDTQYEESEM